MKNVDDRIRTFASTFRSAVERRTTGPAIATGRPPQNFAIYVRNMLT